MQTGVIKRMAFRAVAVLLSVAVVALTIEVTLRVLYARDQARGGDLRRRLERSRNTPLGQTTGSFNMSGLIQPSLYSNIVYELKPGLQGGFRGKQVAINQAGLRGPEVSVAKPADVFRIVGLGDSVMFGWGVGQADYYLQVLQDRLNARNDGRRYESLNFGVPGYNTSMEVAVLEHKGMPFEPDLIILQFINNDLGLPLFMEQPRDALSFHDSCLLEFIDKRLSWARGDVGQYLETRKLGDVPREEAKRICGPYWWMTGPAGFNAAMARLAYLTGHAPAAPGAATRRRIPVIIMRGTFSPGQESLIAAAAQQYGFEQLDIGPVTRRRMIEMGYPDEPAARTQAIRIGPGDHHPNELGHTIYADGLQELMGAMGLIDNTNVSHLAVQSLSTN